MCHSSNTGENQTYWNRRQRKVKGKRLKDAPGGAAGTRWRIPLTPDGRTPPPLPVFCRPYGTLGDDDLSIPTVETVGYCRSPLRGGWGRRKRIVGATQVRRTRDNSPAIYRWANCPRRMSGSGPSLDGAGAIVSIGRGSADAGWTQSGKPVRRISGDEGTGHHSRMVFPSSSASVAIG